MKEFRIEIPEGYEIDKEKSTFEKIVFKEVKQELPKTWEDLGRVNGFYVCDLSKVLTYEGVSKNHNQNTFASREQAEAAIALAQLSQLKKVYNGEWEADWTNDRQKKHCINLYKGAMFTGVYDSSCNFLSFKDADTRDMFLENFRDLIEKAKPLML